MTSGCESHSESTLTTEHEEINRSLLDLESEGDRIGDFARQLLHALRPHLEKEEKLVVPVLESLNGLASGRRENAERSAALSGRLSAEYRTMFKEHQGIVSALNRLREEAMKTGNSDA
ncbi:MAG: hemerythrin domain-containing protein, partial [Thermoprotei archaeon]